MAEAASAQGPASPPAATPQPRVVEFSRTVSRARMRPRHWLILASFVLCVLTPLAVAGWYLFARAADQFASEVGFTVRREEGVSGLDILGGLGALTGTSASSDTDILYKFIQSQEMVRHALDMLDLREIWSGPVATDPVFALDPDATIEDLVAYWGRMVRVFYDPGTGLIEVEVRAFDPQSARDIAQVIFDRSSAMINELSAVARADMTRYAREELEQALEQLRTARQALTMFRNETQIVDVGADLQGQMGVLNSLQGQLAEALIELDLLAETAREGDPRLDQARRRIAVIERRIEEERAKVGGVGAAGGQAFADLVGEFESLQVDVEFAQETYLSARAAYDSTIADARRQNRYLAAYVEPTLAETAIYPRRGILLALAALVLAGSWTIIVLIYYSLRDRR